MKILYLKTIVCLLFFLFAQNSLAAQDDRAYIMLRIGKALIKGKESKEYEPGYNKVKVKHDNPSVLDGEIGYRVSPNIRLGLNFTYMPKWKVTDNASYQSHHNAEITCHSFHQTYISSLSTTINAYYDLNQLSLYNITPYVMVGAGIAVNEIADSDNYIDNVAITKLYRHSITNFAWKAGLGVNYNFDDKLFLGLGYTYADLGKISSKISMSYPSYKPFTKPQGDNYRSKLEKDEISNHFKKLTSHQFLVGVGIKF